MFLQPREPHAPYATTLRYQLFTACAAAVAEAHRRHVDRAVLLVHDFVTPATNDEKHARNAADLDAFLSRLGSGSSRFESTGQLHGPFAAASFPAIRLFVGKVVRQLRS